jgi:fibronectin-binding autotransporter adhesin
MRRPRSMLFTLCCLLAAPLVAQPEIGGNTCSSATLSGIYAFSLTGRQVTSSGTFSNVFQGNGSANFDGLSKVTITLTTDTVRSVATPLTWSGTYSMQANCAGTVTITSGGSPTLNLVSYDQGVDFLVTGNDAVYSYSGTGNTQPSGCSAATLSGVYVFTATGYELSGTSVNGVVNETGLLQFDGVSNVTVNGTLSSSGNTTKPGTATGSYSVSSTCVGSATVTVDGGTFVVALSVTNSSAANGAFDLAVAGSGVFMVSGSGHAVYGQPTATAANQEAGDQPAAEAFAELSPETVTRRKI